LSYGRLAEKYQFFVPVTSCLRLPQIHRPASPVKPTEDFPLLPERSRMMGQNAWRDDIGGRRKLPARQVAPPGYPSGERSAVSLRGPPSRSAKPLKSGLSWVRKSNSFSDLADPSSSRGRSTCCSIRLSLDRGYHV